MDKFLNTFGREKNEKRVTEVIKGEEGDEVKENKVLIAFLGRRVYNRGV